MERRIFDEKGIPQGWQPLNEGVEKGISKPQPAAAVKPPPPPSPQPKTSK